MGSGVITTSNLFLGSDLSIMADQSPQSPVGICVVLCRNEKVAYANVSLTGGERLFSGSAGVGLVGISSSTGPMEKGKLL